MKISHVLKNISFKLASVSVIDENLIAELKSISANFDSAINPVLNRILNDFNLVEELRTIKIKDNNARKQLLLREFPEKFIIYLQEILSNKYQLNLALTPNDINYMFVRDTLNSILNNPEVVNLIIQRYNSLLNMRMQKGKRWIWQPLKIEEGLKELQNEEFPNEEELPEEELSEEKEEK